MNHNQLTQKMGAYTILYVEDDIEVRQYIAEFLRRYFKKVYESDSAEEGWELYGTHHPDVLLLDINLRGMSGIELATLVRQHDTKTRILISTAYTNKEFMLQAIELSLTRYLVKPMTNEDLGMALEKCWQELEHQNHIDLGEGYLYSRTMATIFKEERAIALRNKEVEILEYFIEHEGEVLRYDQLEADIWREEIMSRDAIRSQIRNIRKKMEIDLFTNISGLGYQFNRKVES